MNTLSPGARSMLIAAAFFAIGALCIKLAGSNLPPMEILFGRSVIGIIYCAVLIKRAGITNLGKRKGLLALRGLLGLSALFLHFYAYVHLPLGEATVILFLYPLFTVLLAAVLLKETLPRTVFPCLAVCVFGLVLIAKPAFLFGSMHPIDPMALGAALLGAVLSSFALITVSTLGKNEHPLVIIMYPSLCVVLFGPFTAPIDWVVPTSTDLVLLAGVGLFMNIGQHFMTVAYKLEKASVISAVSYSEIVFATALGILFLGESPDMYTAAGSVLVIAASMYMSLKK